MTKNRHLYFHFVWMLLLPIFAGSQSTRPSVQPVGGRPDDVTKALHTPHEYAWQVFFFLNLQADATSAGRAAAQTLNIYGDDAPVVWETWALASGGRAGSRRQTPNASEVFLDDGGEPKAWGRWRRASEKEPRTLSFLGKKLEYHSLLNQRIPSHAFLQEGINLSNVPENWLQSLRTPDPSIPNRSSVQFEGGRKTADEVRMNQATYNFIRTHKLYYTQGLKAFAQNKQQRRQKIDFPLDSQEVKAQWIEIPENEKNKYHWRMIGGKVWGLSGLHIITKDLPNWFWATFEHIDYRSQAELPENDPARNGIPHPNTRNTKWQYYRLRGIQTDFVSSSGIPTVLANTQIEKGFQSSSSCITCHSRATINVQNNGSFHLPIFAERDPVILGFLGSPDRKWFEDSSGNTKFMQTDFLWSIPFRVLPKPNP